MLASKRLKYRQVGPSDKSESLSMAQNNEVMAYITGAALSLEEAEKRFQYQLQVNKNNKGLGFLRAESIETEEFIGYIKMTPIAPEELEIGYAILPKYWGKGYATEMLVAMEAFAESIPKIETLVGIVNTSNMASANVLLKRNFTLQKELGTEARYTKNIH